MMHGLVKRAGTATAVVLLGVTTLAACGGGSDAVKTAIDKATNGKVKVDKNGNQITIKDKNGGGSMSFGGGTDLPKDFPKGDVPLPKNAKLQAAISGDQNGKQYFALTYVVDNNGDLAKVADDYKSALEDAGFKAEGSMDVGGKGGGFSAFTAKGTDWDVSVFSSGGGGSKGQQGGLQVSVTTHDSSTDSSSTTDTTG